PQLARALERLLDRHGWALPPNEVSNAPEGNPADGHPEDTDIIARLRVNGADVPVTVRRVTTSGGAPHWLISRDFVSRIPMMEEGSRPGLIDRWMPEPLKNFRVFGAGAGHWFTMLALYLLAYLAAGIFVRILRMFLQRILQRRGMHPDTGPTLLERLETPLRVFLMV